MLWDCSVLGGCSRDELEQDCLGNQFVYFDTKEGFDQGYPLFSVIF